MTSGEHASRCAVLIGGAGSRLGGDKHLRELGGEPLAWWVLDAARHAHLEPLLVAKHGTPLGRLAGECEVLIETTAERHPLIGVIEALDEIGEPLVVAPCDMPLVPSQLLRLLAEAPEPTVVAGPGGVEPLLGRYEPGSLEVLRQTVAAGASARDAVAQIGASELGGKPLSKLGDPASYLRNLNTPDELGILDRELSVPELERPVRD